MTDTVFRDIKDTLEVTNADLVVSNEEQILDTWRIKTKNGKVHAIARKVAEGLHIDAYYPKLGYLYVRQICSGIKSYEGKKFKLRVEMSRDSWQPLGYDVYISSRYSKDDSDRVHVIDTETKSLTRGHNSISVEFEVPRSDKEAKEINGLSVAFRLIGNNQNTAFTINSIKLEEVDSEVTFESELCELMKKYNKCKVA